MKTKILILVLLSIFIISTLAFTGPKITDVKCTCGCVYKAAVLCLCPTAFKELYDSGFTDEDIKKFIINLKSKRI